MRALRPLLILIAVILPVALVGLGLWYVTRPVPPLSPELDTPKLAMEPIASLLRTKPLFFTMAAVPYVKEHWQDWSVPFGLPTPLPEELAVSFEAASQSSQAWRTLDRKWHFGALLLCGDPAGFRPLLDHLRGAPDWTLTRVGPTSLVFERNPAKAWTPADLPSLLAVFNTHSATEQKMARYLIAHRLMFLGETQAAKTLLEGVIAGDPKCKEAWTELANLHGMLGQWQESIKAVSSALAVDRRYRPAQMAQANASYALGRFEDALEVSRMLYESAPSDGTTLLLHAKITHAAHAYQEEIEVLHKVINMVRTASQPVGVWQIYLGQAYASTGDAAQAREQFHEAMKDTTISDSDREFIKSALQRVEPKSDLLDNVPPLPKSSLLDAPAYRP